MHENYENSAICRIKIAVNSAKYKLIKCPAVSLFGHSIIMSTAKYTKKYLERDLFRLKMMYVEDSFKDEFAVVFFNKCCVHRMLNSLLNLLFC